MIPTIAKDFPSRLVVRCASDHTKVHQRINLNGHDDWDCADDALYSNMLTFLGTGLQPVFKLTDYGWACIQAISEAQGAFLTMVMPDRSLFDGEGKRL